MPDPSKFPNPAALARILSQSSGETITEAQILADIEAGAPIDEGGGINPVFYAAWILKHEKFRHTKFGAK